MVCDLCSNVESADLNATHSANQILTCENCGLRVHQYCYGILAYTDEWTCSFCESGEDQESKRCVLCPSTNGAFKRTTDKKWVHVLCAMYNARSVIKNVQTMEPINILHISKKSKECYICNIEAPGCVNCAVKKCNKSLHVTCGQTKGLLAEENSSTGLSFLVYCEDHVPDNASISSSSISKNLRSRKRASLTKLAKRINSDWLTHISQVSKIVNRFDISTDMICGEFKRCGY